jgi:hypothetical protein
VRNEGQIRVYSRNSCSHTRPMTDSTSACNRRPSLCSACVFIENLGGGNRSHGHTSTNRKNCADPVSIIAHMPPSVWLAASNAADISVALSLLLSGTMVCKRV